MCGLPNRRCNGRAPRGPCRLQLTDLTCRSVCHEQRGGVVVETQQDVRVSDVGGDDCCALHLRAFTGTT